jgi:hypothetical protein
MHLRTVMEGPWPPGAVGVDEQSMSIHSGNDTM